MKALIHIKPYVLEYRDQADPPVGNFELTAQIAHLSASILAMATIEDRISKDLQGIRESKNVGHL